LTPYNCSFSFPIEVEVSSDLLRVLTDSIGFVVEGEGGVVEVVIVAFVDEVDIDVLVVATAVVGAILLFLAVPFAIPSPC
jgi:hypothetical protein